MHIVFSVDDLTDSFWPPPPPEPSPSPSPSQQQNMPPDGMTRSQSEWAFQRLLREMSASDETPTTINVRSPPPVHSEQSLSTADVVEIQKPPPPPQNPAAGDDDGERGNRRSSDPLDPNQYHEILKSKLEIACAAVARRVGAVKPEDSIPSGVNQKLSPPPVGSQPQPQGAVVVAQTSPGGSSVRSVPSTSVKKKPDVVPARQTTSISSRDDSDDDDLDGDTETADNGDPTDVKRARRMLSNRESARRSRRRKQEQMNEFDTQVNQLRTEHSTLLGRLTDMNQKYDAAAVDNRILRADIETLRTKVKMAEETVKRVTGVNPLQWARPNMGMPVNNTPRIPSITGTGSAPNQRVEVNREGTPNLYEPMPHWNHKH